MSRRPGRRVDGRPVIVLGLTLAALLLGLAAMNLLAGEADGGHGDMAARVEAYRVVYRVEQLVDDPPTVTWEERIVQRPFHGRSATLRTRPPGGPRPAPAVAGVLTTDTHVYALSADGLQEVAGRVPGVPGGDNALAVVLDEAVDRGLAQPGGQRTVSGRRCRVYRLAGLHHLPLAAIEGDDHSDVCLDDDGIILSEEWTLDGRLVQVRTAVEVDLSPPAAVLRAALSAEGAAPPPPQIEPPLVERDPAATTFLPPPDAPPGFEATSVVRVVMPASVGNPDATPGSIRYTSVAWVFVRGPDVVTVEAGEGAPAWSPDARAASVELSGLGVAQSVLGPDGSELRVEQGNRWVRVRGTVPPGQLTAWASRLRGPPSDDAGEWG